MKYRKHKRFQDDDDSDEIYDEIDKFNKLRDSTPDKDTLRVREKEELLNVEGDASEDESSAEGVSGDTDMSDFDSPEEDVESVLPSSNKWTNKKSQFYGTSYIDHDWGGMNEKELEVAEFEEQDATERQKNLDATLSFLMDERRAMMSDNKHVKLEAVSEKTTEITESEMLDKFSELNPDFEHMLKEYTGKREIFFNLIKPLKEAVDTICGKRRTALEQTVLTAYNVYISYLINITFYLRLKLTTGLKSIQARKLLDDHPVIDAIIDGKKMLQSIDSFLAKNDDKVSQILKMYKEGRPLNDISDLSRIFGDEDRMRKRKVRKSECDNVDTDEHLDKDKFPGEVEDYDNDGSQSTEEKRLVTAEIVKNKGLTSKRKKGTKHSRVKKRKQYEKALIKKRSQRPDVRRELEPYSGEKRGIRVSTVKSVKLRA